MKLYRVYGYRKFELPSFTAYNLDDFQYFKTLHEALCYIHRFIDLENVWAVQLYDGFIPLKYVARNSYFGG